MDDQNVTGVTYDTLKSVVDYSLRGQLVAIVNFLSAPNEDGTPCSVDRAVLAERVLKEFGG